MNRSAPERPTIGAFVIAKDEESNIAGCLGTLRFCDETVVVDGGSADRTVELARQAGANVVVRKDWRGYGVQKQRALGCMTTDWVLSIDADERVPEALAAEIVAAVGRTGRAGILDGRQGLVAAVYRAEETFWRYLAAGWEKGR